MIGGYSLVIDSVSITGDAGEVQACNDSSQLFLVKKGDDQPGVGSQQLTEFATTYGVVRQDDDWVVSELESENQPC